MFNGITTIVVSGLVGSLSALITYYFKSSREREEKKKHDRLTKLLAPLFVEISRIESLWDVSLVSDNYEPADYLDDLPKNLKSVNDIIRKYIYLADDTLVVAALVFMVWTEKASVDKSRWDKIMTGKINEVDEPYRVFKMIVENQFARERKQFVNGGNFRESLSRLVQLVRLRIARYQKKFELSKYRVT